MEAVENKHDNLGGEEIMHDQKGVLWENSQNNEIIRRLKNGESFQSIMDSLEKSSEVFTDLNTIVCSDGRVLPLNGTKLGIAGEGILLNEDELNRFVEKYKGKIKKVTSHEDCGAAGIAFSKDQKGKEKPDDLGIEFAEHLANLLGAEYEHIPMSKMRNEIHDERFIFFDGTGKFNPAAIKEMPGNFVSSGSGFGFNDEYMKTELEALTKIALGSHGFGERLNAENPFRIIISANDEEQKGKLVAIAKTVANKFEGRVMVDSFVV